MSTTESSPASGASPVATPAPRDLLPGVTSHRITTDRLGMHWLESGPPDGEVVVLLHGMLSTSRFWEHVLPLLPDRYRVLVPDMRGNGRSDPEPTDATAGVGDWVEDSRSLLRALAVEGPVHVGGWSTGGAACARWAITHPGEVRSLALVGPVSPHGYGAQHADGRPWFEDCAGSGGGLGSRGTARRMQAGDRTRESLTSPLNLMTTAYWSPAYEMPEERLELLLDDLLLTHVGDGGYPGDRTESPNWPGYAPGTTGIMNALSPKYLSWAALPGTDPKPPVLWVHGSEDLVISDENPLDLARLGEQGMIPGWPGAATCPPQPMVTQIRQVLDGYRDAGGRVRGEMFEGSGHAPMIDAAQRWADLYTDFLAAV